MTTSDALPFRVVATPDYESVMAASTQLIDVRRPEEVAGGTLPGAVNIPLDQLEARVDELDPTRRVVLLCRSGNRSATAAQFLSTRGFDDLVNLAGGMLAMEPERG